MSKHRQRLCILIPACLLLAGAGCAGKKETQQMMSDLDELKRQVYELNRMQQETDRRVAALLEACSVEGLRATQADLNQTLEALRSEVQTLGTRLDRAARNEAALSERLDQCLRTRFVAPVVPSTPPLPSEQAEETRPSTPPQQRAEELYKAAYGDYIQDNLDLAIEGFKQLLSAYPDSELADNAEYWIGESYYRQGRVTQALEAFERVVRRHPQGDKRADAMVRKAFILFERRQPAQAAVILNEVMEDYPGTPAAAQARAKLRDEGFLN